MPSINLLSDELSRTSEPIITNVVHSIPKPVSTIADVIGLLLFASTEKSILSVPTIRCKSGGSGYGIVHVARFFM